MEKLGECTPLLQSKSIQTFQPRIFDRPPATGSNSNQRPRLQGDTDIQPTAEKESHGKEAAGSLRELSPTPPNLSKSTALPFPSPKHVQPEPQRNTSSQSSPLFFRDLHNIAWRSAKAKSRPPVACAIDGFEPNNDEKSLLLNSAGFPLDYHLLLSPRMQFNNALSQSYSASLPGDEFLVQAFAQPENEETQAQQAQADELEERRLRRRERQKLRQNKSRRPSTLHSFILGADDRLDPTLEEEDTDDEEDDDNNSVFDEESVVGGPNESRISAAPPGRQSRLGTMSENSLLPVPPSPGGASRKLSSKSSRRPSHLSPVSENSPLLGAGRRASMATLTPKPLQRMFKGPTASASRKELTILAWYTIPIFLTHLLEYSLLLATIVSVGHLGTAELAASSLGSMTTNVCALSLIQGLCAALDTLCSQSYSSPNPKETSLHALRTAYLAFIIMIPSIIVILNGETLLLALRQDPEVAALAGQYLKVLVFGIPGYAGFEITRRWLQCQGLMIVPTISLIIASPINIFLNWLLVWGPDRFRLGFIGAPVSTAISFNVMFLFSALYCIFLAPRDAWGGFTWKMFSGLRPNIILGAAGFASVASEWWAWEVVGIASAFLGTDNLGANSVLGTSASLLYQLPAGLTVAAAVRVGNLVGAQLPYAARTSAKTALGMSAVIGLINSSLLLVLKKRWGRLFSSDDKVVAIVADVIPLVGLFQFTDSITGACMGVLRGTGLATLGAKINIAAYWVIGIPIGLALTFSRLHWELYGLWTGLTVALTFTSIAGCLVIARINWPQIVKDAKENGGIAAGGH